MKKLSVIFKVLARIVGVLCLVYGYFVGFSGSGPDGPHHSTILTLIGLYIFLLGILYLWPNHNFTKKQMNTICYLVVTLPPILFIFGYAIYSIVNSGWNDFVNQDGHIILPIYLTLSLFAPLSIILEYKEKTFNKSLNLTSRTSAALNADDSGGAAA
jgi:hypothetical protein